MDVERPPTTEHGALLRTGTGGCFLHANAKGAQCKSLYFTRAPAEDPLPLPLPLPLLAAAALAPPALSARASSSSLPTEEKRSVAFTRTVVQ